MNADDSAWDRVHEEASPSTAGDQGRVLPEGYYLDNFETILSSVQERHDDLLAEEERAFLASWEGLDTAARRFYVRLLSRKGPILRHDRLTYAEIPDLGAALAALRRAGFADDAPDAPGAELLGLLLRAELTELVAELLPEAARPPRTARKSVLLAALAEAVEDDDLAAAVRCRLEVVAPLRLEEVLVFRLLFFGNLGQDWTEFVLRDLGVVRFEPYELKRELRLYPSRAVLDDDLELRQRRTEVELLLLAEEVEEAVELGAEVVRRHADCHPVSRRQLDRLCLRLGRVLERAGRDQEALGLYAATETPPSRERRARILARAERHDEALALLGEIAAAPRDETEAVFAPRFAHDVRRKRGETVPRRRRPRRPIRDLAVLRLDGVAVETLALEALAAEGRRGFFSENWLWRSLFGLAFWDVVFAPIRGAFLHPFQYGPLDLRSPDFRKARRELFNGRLAELESETDLSPRLLAVYDEKRGTANPFVAWQEELRPFLELALERLTGPHLARVADRLSRDLPRYRRGFPDLFVTSEEKPGFELYEVKGPGDQLRPEQGAWIDYLNANGLPAKVLKVTF